MTHHCLSSLTWFPLIDYLPTHCAQMTDPMPSAGSIHTVEETFTEAEIKAFYDTRDLLLAKGFKKEDLEQRTLFLTVINCKLRPESAAEKYKKLLENLKLFNITSYPQIWAGLDDSPEGEAEWAKIKPLLTAYGGAGRDKQDRGIMWIRTRGIPPEEETLSVRTSIIYWFCVHADMRSLREGITFVLDTTHNDFDRKHGNESKLQRTWQSIPLRPQRIFIHGANYIKRVIINALLTVASYFTSEKVIERIRFADLPEILTEVDEDSLPVYMGGKGAGLVDETELLKWVRHRLAAHPKIPDLF